MEGPIDLVESFFEKVEEYGKTTYELSKLKVLATTISLVTLLVSRVSVIVMFGLFALVLNIGIALWLGELLGKSYFGFFIVAAFYLLAGVIFSFFLQKWIKKPISDLIIAQALQ